MAWVEQESPLLVLNQVTDVILYQSVISFKERLQIDRLQIDRLIDRDTDSG